MGIQTSVTNIPISPLADPTMDAPNDPPIEAIRDAWHASDLNRAAALVYLAYGSRIQRYLQRSLTNQVEAEDARSVWSTMIVEALPRFEWRGLDMKKTLTAWVFVLARRARFHILAERRRNPVAESVSSRRTAAADASSFQTLNDVPDEVRARALELRAVLDDEEQELMRLYGDSSLDLTWADVVAIMSDGHLDKARRTAEDQRLRRRWSRAKDKLRAAAEELGLRRIVDAKRDLVNARKR